VSERHPIDVIGVAGRRGWRRRVTPFGSDNFFDFF
jgi:hypothetical protein